MGSSLLLQQCSACLIGLTWIVFVMGGKWSYRYSFKAFYLQTLFSIACSILVQLPSSFFSIRLVSVHVVHPYSSIDTTAAWKKQRFILYIPFFSFLSHYSSFFAFVCLLVCLFPFFFRSVFLFRFFYLFIVFVCVLLSFFLSFFFLFCLIIDFFSFCLDFLYSYSANIIRKRYESNDSHSWYWYNRREDWDL